MIFIRKVWFNTPPQTCLPQICAYAAAQIRQRLQKFGIKPDGIINFLTERASSIRQRLQDTPPLCSGEAHRAVAIGGYFKNGKGSLILYARVYKPTDRTPDGSKGILDFTGNFIVTQTVKTGKINFIPSNNVIIHGANWFSNGIIFSDNSIVKASFLYSHENEDEIKKEAGDDIYMQYVNLADIYIKDELKDNDDKILGLLNDAYNNSADLPVRLAAKLNTFLYYLYINDVDSAEAALTTAAQLANGPERINPDFRRVIDIEAPTMLKIYKNNAAVQP